MLSILANHNNDIKRLIDKGYAVSIDSNYLIVRDIPYLNLNKKLQIGAIVSKLVFVNEHQVRQEDHQIFFCGSHPSEADCSPIRNLGGGPATLKLKSVDITVQRSFSNKPTNGYKDLFEKVETYVAIISGPAMDLFDVTPYTFRSIEGTEDTIFKFRDTLTSRAEIAEISSKLETDSIAIIGLGGTGAYLLDFLIKTRVREIRAFDHDDYHVHNAFRSPGKLDSTELGKKKALVYKDRYENFRNNLFLHGKNIDSNSLEDLSGITFAFVCVDKGSSRSEIFEVLMKLKIPFIDVGMGLDKDRGSLSGTLRATYFSEESPQNVLNQKLVPLSDIPDDIYRNNIQISELNALNACIAIIKYKQLRGFYSDVNKYYHILFTLDSLNCLGENE